MSLFWLTTGEISIVGFFRGLPHNSFGEGGRVVFLVDVLKQA